MRHFIFTPLKAIFILIIFSKIIFTLNAERVKEREREKKEKKHNLQWWTCALIYALCCQLIILSDFNECVYEREYVYVCTLIKIMCASEHLLHAMRMNEGSLCCSYKKYCRNCALEYIFDETDFHYCWRFYFEATAAAAILVSARENICVSFVYWRDFEHG